MVEFEDIIYERKFAMEGSGHDIYAKVLTISHR